MKRLSLTFKKRTLIMVVSVLLVNFSMLFILSCFSFPQNSKVLTAPYKEFLGSASPANYQRIIEEVLLNNNYHIETFDNTQTGAFITTKWKVRDPYPAELDLGYQDVKTKIIITGSIDTQSFSSENNYRYDCYMEVKNLAYDGSVYIESYESPLFKQEMDLISKVIFNNFGLSN